MKNITKAALVLALGLSAFAAMAQDGPPPQGGQRPPQGQGGFGGSQGGPGGGQRGSGSGSEGQRMQPPIIAVLDANHDGTIDQSEIANASGALKKLDKDGDGKLSPEEIHPPMPGGMQGGQGMQGRQGGPGQGSGSNRSQGSPPPRPPGQ